MSLLSLESSTKEKGLYWELWYVMSSVSIEMEPGCCKRKLGSNFNSGSHSIFVVILAKSSYFLCIFYV